MSNKVRLTNNNLKNPVCGRIFIVPNPACKLDEFITGGEDIKNTYMGIEPENDKFVQIWFSDTPSLEKQNYGRENMASGKESHWNDTDNEHIAGFKFNGLRKGVFLQYLPSSYLQGKTEGESIHLEILDDAGENVVGEYTLMCLQGQSRYEDRGKFEEVLARVTA